MNCLFVLYSFFWCYRVCRPRDRAGPVRCLRFPVAGALLQVQLPAERLGADADVGGHVFHIHPLENVRHLLAQAI